MTMAYSSAKRKATELHLNRLEGQTVFIISHGTWKHISRYRALECLMSIFHLTSQSVRVQFEIGHEASVRTKKTPEGFTHDWEVFVRGADNTDIQHFVDKVVFHLHETFPKPKRGIKQPPYVVKESGYAGFVLPIDVYLKNKEEPKKISFQYDLTLQSSGPPISRVLREPRLFQNPSEDFRRKLIRGGGVGVDTPSEQAGEELKPAATVPQSKSKAVETPVKKHKSDQPLNHSFAELFGTPIRRVPEQKKLPEPPKKIDDRKKSSKPYKDEKETPKDKYSEREKSKEKPKRPPSPLPPPPTAPFKAKEEHKKHEDKEKKKEEERKKRKDEKDKKEKIKEPERQLEREHKKEKKESRDGDYAKKLNSKPPDVKANYEKHNSEGVGVDKEREKLEKEKHKHRHKKKEKEKNRDKEKHRKEKEKDSREREREKTSKKKHEEAREKEEKRRKSRSASPVQVKKGPLNALLDELGSSDSASPLSEDEPMPAVAVKSLPKPPAKPVPETKPQTSLGVAPKPKSTNSNETAPKLDDPSPNKNKKEKSSSKKSKKSDKDPDKKKEKEEHRARSISSERAEREEEEEVERSNKEERQEKDRLDEDKQKPKDKEMRKRKREKSEEKQTKSKKGEAGAPEGADGAPEELRRPDKFTKEYVAQLKDLQRRIMTLEDNAELQKVVKVIAETGQYEVTKKTFDFDLCALDLETVKRLQDFFAPT